MRFGEFVDAEENGAANRNPHHSRHHPSKQPTDHKILFRFCPIEIISVFVKLQVSTAKFLIYAKFGYFSVRLAENYESVDCNQSEWKFTNKIEHF